MAQTFYINTATKEYSKDNITWYSVSSFKTTRNATVVIFNEQEDAIGNDTYSDEVMKIDITADTIVIDGSTTRAPGYFTTATLVTYLQSVFPKANSGNGGSGNSANINVTIKEDNSSAFSSVSDGQANDFEVDGVVSRFIKSSSGAKQIITYPVYS